MAWVYNGNRSYFANLVVQKNLIVQGNETVSGQLEVVGNTFLDSQLTVLGGQFNRGPIGVENEKWITTLRPVVQPGPVPRVTPNIQFQPRTLLGTLSMTGDDAVACMIYPTGMVKIVGRLNIPLAARADGSIIMDLNNTLLEKRLWPAYNHTFMLDGPGRSPGTQQPIIVLRPSGVFQIYNCDTAVAGAVQFTICAGVWSPTAVNGNTTGPEYQGYFYGNGGY